jgi:hypothetical protein
MTKPQPGDRIRIVIEKTLGKLERVGYSALTGLDTLGEFDGVYYSTAPGDNRQVVSVEVIDHPFRPRQGDVVRDARGDLWRWPHSEHSWGLVYCFSGEPNTSGVPVGRLTLVLRDGQPVTA